MGMGVVFMAMFMAMATIGVVFMGVVVMMVVIMRMIVIVLVLCAARVLQPKSRHRISSHAPQPTNLLKCTPQRILHIRRN